MNSVEKQILSELIDAQGKSVAIGGYYKPDYASAAQVMRPSITLNSIIAKI
jgi:isocitrate dehydrogenase